MPRLRKTALTHFIRTECYRQLRLNLSRMPERIAEGMPPRQPRPGFPRAAEEGKAWQAELCKQQYVIGIVVGLIGFNPCFIRCSSVSSHAEAGNTKLIEGFQSLFYWM